MPELQLKPVMTFKATGGPEAGETLLYSVTGLSTDDHCIIGYGGKDYEGKPTWYLHWYRSGRPIDIPTGPHASPEVALKVVSDLRGKEKSR